MNSKDIRTLESFLKEYGMDAGKPSYGSNKSVLKPTSSPLTSKPSASPTTSGPVDNKEKMIAVRASDVPADAIVKDIKSKPMGKVVSRVGDKPKADALVVDTGKPGKQKYQVLPKDQKVFIDNPENQEESAATKLLSKLKIKGKKVRSIKKLLRNSKFNEQREIVFEINFNDPKLAKGALAAPISCGFEAETTWPSLDAGSDEDDDFLDGMSWSDVSDIIYDQEGSRSVRQVEQAFNEWLMDSDYFYETESNVIQDLISDRKEDMQYITDYAYQELGADEVEDYKNEFLDRLNSDEKQDYADWDEDRWAKELIDDKYADEFEEWLADQIRENGEAHDETWERIQSEVDIDDWMRREYGDWYGLLRDQDIFLVSPNSGDGGVEAVANELTPWAEKNSMSNDVHAGEYHSGKSVDNDYWRVEEDSSIEADGAAAEIISPVYETPEQMLKEMNSLFDFFAKNDVETNESTGLHVTMSWNGEQTEPNKLKMAVLLGDKYLLSLFDRENNTYTQSQFDRVKQGVSELMKNPANLKTLAAVEEILSSKISDGKFSSINFKEATNSAGNNLIEFRIGGGDDYHMKTTDIVKSVVRYSAIMQAGHDPNAFRKDYILALYRLIRKESDVDIEKIKSMNIAYGDAGKNPMLAALQSSSHKNNISSVTDYLTKGLELIAKAKEMYKQQPQGDLFMPKESVNEDDGYAAAEAARLYDLGKQTVLTALAITAMDVGLGLVSAPKATHIAAIRKGVKELGFTSGSLWQGMLGNSTVLNIAHERGLDNYELQDALSKGLSAMLKTNLGIQPAQPKAVVKYKAGDVIYVNDDHLNDVQHGQADPSMFLIVPPEAQSSNEAFKEKFGIEKWSATRLMDRDLKNITAKTGIKFMKESVFEQFEKLSLEEQLRILENVDSEKLNEAWSKKYKDSINCSNPKGFSQKAHCDGKKKNEDIEVDENLKQWFKDKWVRFGPDGKIRGDCARGDDSEGKPKCLPQSKAHSLGKKGRASAARRKRREDPNPERKGAAKNVATKKESVAEYTDIPFNTCPSCGGSIVHESQSQLNEKQDACYHKVKARYKVWPSAYASGALVQCRKKGAKNWGKSKKESVGEGYGRYWCSTDKKWKERQGPKQKRSVKESAVPDNRKIRLLNKLLSKPLLASDIGAQMEAFFAIPDPLMVNEFRKQRAMAGDNVDLRPIVKGFIDYALHPDLKKQVNISESVVVEAKGIMGRVAGDKFVKGDKQLEFQGVNVYPEDKQQFDSPEERDAAVAEFEKQAGAHIEWTNVPNRGALAFGIAMLTDPLNNDKVTYWGRYFKAKMVDMMGAWGNAQVPAGWKLQKAGALKLDIGIDPQHLIKSEKRHVSIDDVIATVASNSQGHQMQGELVGGLEQIKSGQNPVFENDIQHLPALRDYFGEIMGPCALMAGMVKGQAEDANRDLLKGAGWDKCQVFWPQSMNYALVDSIFIGPNGEEVGVSSKGGKGARASAKNIADAIRKAPDKMVKKYRMTVEIIKIVDETSALDAPFRLAELAKILPANLEREVKSYIKSGKTDYVGLSADAKELFNYGTPRQDVPGFNTGYALLALLAKKVAAAVNQAPAFSEGCIAFLNQSSIVQLYCKMGKSGQDARVTGWDAVYPPNFQGRVVLDGSKNYYSSRIGGKFAFGFV